MKLILGLGNPGREYQETRHNIGFMVADELADRFDLKWRNYAAADIEYAKNFGDKAFWVAKPLTFMNASGWAVQTFASFHRVEPQDMLVVVDDVDLPLGKLRIRPKGSAGTHNGLKSVIAHCGTNLFPRLRVGVGRGDKRRDLADYVLSKFDPDEIPVVKSVITRAANAAEMFVTEDISQVMTMYNTDAATSEATD